MRLTIAGACVAALLVSAACADTTAESPDIADALENSLDAANISDVDVSQDREKHVVTLSGEVHTEADKARAGDMAKAVAPNDVIANEIRVVPMGMEDQARSVTSDLDAGITNNLNAAFTQAGWTEGITHRVEAGVVTLSGSVRTSAIRSQVERTAAGVPNVKQVVNTLEVRDQPATTTTR